MLILAGFHHQEIGFIMIDVIDVKHAARYLREAEHRILRGEPFLFEGRLYPSSEFTAAIERPHIVTKIRGML